MFSMKKEIALLSTGAVFFVAAFLIRSTVPNLSLVFFLASFLVSGMKIIISAVKGVLRGDIFNENTLMLIAAVGAFFIKEYSEAVFVVLFYRVGEIFEDYAVKKTRKSVSEVMDICPKYAKVIRGGKVITVSPDEVKIGEVILISAGERVPLDGVIIEGASFLDTSALTGEALPREAIEGEEILSGCINKNATLKVRITKNFEDSTVSRILELVETASAKKSSSERFITKFAKYYTPAVLISALLIAVVPPLVINGANFEDYIYRALSFLVVSCPCALVISVPLAFFGGIGGAAKEGILIKGGSYIEALSKAEKAVFDKTGTLTSGSFKVSDISPKGINEQELIELAAYAENISIHPIAQSVREVYGKEINPERISSSYELTGRGVKSVVDGKTVIVGNSKLMKDMGIDCREKAGITTVFVAVNNAFAGSITVTDKIKPDAKTGIAALKNLGIAKTYMLTGDVREVAEHVSFELGIDCVASELMPEQKVSELERIMGTSKGKTLYVGDGINDAPVLARADIGIAMGALGSDAAVEVADIVVMTDEISKIETAVKISKKTMSIAKQNIVFSLAVKLSILLLCSVDVVGMGVAVFGDVGVMCLAVLNSFRALRRRKRKAY